MSNSNKFVPMGELQSLLDVAKSLSPIQQRQVGAVIGACIGDAAARPLHWLYNDEELHQTVGDNEPEFWPISCSPFYTRDTGMHSSYWDTAAQTLTLLAQDQRFDHEAWKKLLLTRFGNKSDYSEALKLRHDVYKPGKKYAWRQPIKGPWMHQSVQAFIRNLQSQAEGNLGDAEHSETDGFTVSVPRIVVLPMLLENQYALQDLKKMVGTLSATSESIDHAVVAATILQSAIVSECQNPLDLVSDIIEKIDNFKIEAEIQEVLKATDMGHSQACKLFGKTCELPGNFKSALHAIVSARHDGSENGKSTLFKESIRKVINAGGCNCSRAIFVGSVIGGFVGIEGIPTKWILQTHDGLETLKKAIQIVSSNNLNKLAPSKIKSKY